MTTGYLYHELFGWHDTGTSAGVFGADPAVGLQPFIHFENADTKRRLHELVVVSELIEQLHRLKPIRASEEQILAVHARDYLERIKVDSASPRGGDAGDGHSPFGKGSYEIAALAAGGVITAVEAVVRGDVANSYALVRPPGHHARPTTGMGFCLFANVAIAVRHARSALGVGRVAVVDWDVHHGNGTQEIFYADPDVLTISLHQDNLFPPDSGAAAERGDGAGFGYAVNVPLPPGTGDGGYLYAMDQAVVPALRAFEPELILVACGFDACTYDPLGHQMVTSDGYRQLTSRLMAVADEVCGGRITVAHEGGYSAVYVPFCGLAVIETLSGAEPFGDPLLSSFARYAGRDLQPHQRAVIDHVASYAADIHPPAPTPAT